MFLPGRQIIPRLRRGILHHTRPSQVPYNEKGIVCVLLLFVVVLAVVHFLRTQFTFSCLGSLAGESFFCIWLESPTELDDVTLCVIALHPSTNDKPLVLPPIVGCGHPVLGACGTIKLPWYAKHVLDGSSWELRMVNKYATFWNVRSICLLFASLFWICVHLRSISHQVSGTWYQVPTRWNASGTQRLF
jgi:hypothetical protein